MNSFYYFNCFVGCRELTSEDVVTVIVIIISCEDDYDDQTEKMKKVGGSSGWVFGCWQRKHFFFFLRKSLKKDLHL